jgi:RNA polymerase sigma factor (TIGR02999 family)
VDRTDDITHLLHGCRDGDDLARTRLFALVYDELKGIARRQAPRGRRESTLDTTALVHETYARLASSAALDATSRAHFYALCARAMRQVVIDHARRHAAEKRGGGSAQVMLDDADAPVDADPAMLVALDQALALLDARDPRLVRLVELRAFAGLSMEEIAELLGVTIRTVQRDWLRARAWLDAALQA